MTPKPTTPDYVGCPRCNGEGQVFAYTRPPGHGEAGMGEFFSCPVCGGTGQASAEKAAEWKARSDDPEED